VFVALPAERRLDPHVFGTPKNPRAFGGTPGINGVPLMPRGQSGGQYTRMMKKTPFGDAYMALPDGTLMVDGTDITATDAATTKDTVKMKASWKDKAGNTYTVSCCKMMAAHGVEFPTFGGVVTNVILHGFTRKGLQARLRLRGNAHAPALPPHGSTDEAGHEERDIRA